MADHDRQQSDHGSKQFSIRKAAFVLGGALVGGFVLYKVTKPMLISLALHIVNSQKKGQDTGEGTRTIAVEAEKVIATTMPKHINTIGELKANRSVVLRPEISGIVSEILCKEGTEVKKGDVLIKLDDKQLQAEYRTYKAQYDAAKTEFERYEKMRASGAGSGKEYDKVKGDMNTCKAKKEACKANLEKTEIRAPFDGVVGLIDIHEGAYVNPQQQQGLSTLVDASVIKVTFGIPGKFVNDIGVGQAVQMKVDACKGRDFRGIVEAVDSHVDPSTNTVSVRASVPNDDGALKAGLFASVSLIIGEQSGTITVDESAVDRMGEQEFVWIIDRGRARRVPILTGARERGRIEVIAGLKEGQTVVTAGQLRLTEGVWVRITNMEAQAAPASKGEDAASQKGETAALSAAAAA